MRGYLFNMLVAFDQFVNTIFGGHPDETISARWGRTAGPGHPIATVGAAFLNWLDSGHTADAIRHDEKRAETVDAIEEAAQKEGK